MTRLLALTLVVTAFVAGAVSAQPFTRADRNKDGFVDFDEAGRIYPSFTRSQFRRLDLDRDGMISRDEYPQLLNLLDVLGGPR